VIELPPAADLCRLLDYDAETGVLTWKPRGVSGWDKRWAGKPAFNCHWNGYRVGVLLGRRSIGAHRVAFKLVHGFDAPEIDHINGDRADNRIANLRSVTTTENRRNAARPRHNTSGCVGVHFKKDKQKWVAYISLADRYTHIGYFPTKEGAIAARKQAERDHGFHPNHGREARCS
jgi:hypothetical protein